MLLWKALKANTCNAPLSHRYGFMGTPSSHFLLLWLFLTERPWRTEHHLTDDYKSLCQDLKARKYILDELNTQFRHSNFEGFEFLKAVHLEANPFDIERDLMTPTFIGFFI